MTLTADQANRIYDILVREAGADNSANKREYFIASVTTPDFREFRFCGSLGFGGKFRVSFDEWYVSAYPEDMNYQRTGSMVAANTALARLKAVYDARAEVLS